MPLVDAGGTPKIAAIEGRVIGARPGQQIVLYARSGAWYVQPFTDRPFTKIQPDATWRNSTHLGTEYAALLVAPEYRPPAMIDALPNKGGGVIAVAVVPGEVRMLIPVFWHTWWFRLSCGLACLCALLAFHRLRLRRLTQQLNDRFEERLAERTRIAQDLHDTLLQGFLSASMQLHVAVDDLPDDSPVKLRLNHVQQLMGQVIAEGRNTVQGLRSITTDYLDLEQAFSRLPQDLAIHKDTEAEIEFRVIVKGRPRSLHPIIRDEVYRLGRAALVGAFRRSRAKNVEVELKYTTGHLRVLVRDDGHGMNSQTSRSERDEHLELAGLRERAERIGARLKVRSRATAGTEVELSIPSQVAFLNQPPLGSVRWLARLSPRRAIASLRNLGTKEDN